MEGTGGRSATAMQLDEAIRSRRAVRAYEDRPVEESLLLQLIDAAIQAPSAVNEQPWSFCVVRDKVLLRRIGAASRTYVLATTPAGLLSHHLEEVLGDERFDIFYGAPVLIVICSVTRNRWAVENCSLAAQNLMLTARAAGLGSCWIGFAQSWLAEPDGRKALGLPDACVPVAPIIVGYPTSFPPPVPRKPPEIRWIG